MRFADVNVGDRVIIDPHGRWHRCRKVGHVEKVTATRLQADGYWFSKRNGSQVGGGVTTAKKATPELIKEVELEQRYNAACNALRQRLASLETSWHEIDQNHDCHKWAATIEKTLSHLTAAAEVLKVCQTERET